jgi:hypothetical protein
VDKGVNVTLGLPLVRTSPDHGTAFDIAGQGSGRCVQPDRSHGADGANFHRQMRQRPPMRALNLDQKRLTS